MFNLLMGNYVNLQINLWKILYFSVEPCLLYYTMSIPPCLWKGTNLTFHTHLQKSLPKTSAISGPTLT